MPASAPIRATIKAAACLRTKALEKTGGFGLLRLRHTGHPTSSNSNERSHARSCQYLRARHFYDSSTRQLQPACSPREGGLQPSYRSTWIAEIPLEHHQALCGG
jgi:hypothetical protein